MGSDEQRLPALLSPARVTLLGLAVNAVLSAAKLAAGWLCYSGAIFADGLHSLSDCATDLAVLGGIRISGRPADEHHRYGHRRAMTLVTAGLSLVLVAAAGFVAYRAIRELPGDQPHVRAALPLALAIVSILLKEVLYHLTVHSGRRAGDTSVVANAWHHRSDAWSSVAAAAGLAAVLVGGPKWHFVDHVTAMVLASFLVVVAWRILRQAGTELMDQAPAREQMKRIEQAVAATQGVRSFHAFRARRLGGKVEMDIHVQVNPDLTVRAGHDIASEVRRQVVDCCPEVMSVIVHVEPPEE